MRLLSVRFLGFSLVPICFQILRILRHERYTIRVIYADYWLAVVLIKKIHFHGVSQSYYWLFQTSRFIITKQINDSQCHWKMLWLLDIPGSINMRVIYWNKFATACLKLNWASIGINSSIIVFCASWADILSHFLDWGFYTRAILSYA